MSDYSAKTRTAMHKRMAKMNAGKSVLKELVLAGKSVKEIKEGLKDYGFPATVYTYWQERELVAKWRKQLRES